MATEVNRLFCMFCNKDLGEGDPSFFFTSCSECYAKKVTPPTSIVVDRSEWERMRTEQHAWRQCEEKLSNMNDYEHTTKCVIFTAFFEATMKSIAPSPPERNRDGDETIGTFDV